MEPRFDLLKKLILPLTVSVFLLIVYLSLLLFRPVVLFTTDDQGVSHKNSSAKTLLAFLLVCFSIVLVRTVGFVLFDVIFLKRKKREAPALLRGLLSITLYFFFFIFIYRIVLNQFPGVEIIATSTVLTVII